MKTVVRLKRKPKKVLMLTILGEAYEVRRAI